MSRVDALKYYTQAMAQEPVAPSNYNPTLVYQLLGSAALADPTMAAALYKVGAANGSMNLHQGAIAMYRRVLELQPGNLPGDLDQKTLIDTLVNMSFHLYVVGEYEEAEETIARALLLDPENPLGNSNMGLVRSIMGSHEQAVLFADLAHRLDPQNPVIQTACAFAHLYAGDFATGLKHFEARFPYRMKHFLQYPYPKWDGTPGKTIYLQSEQGIGDALSFARFVPEAAKRCKHIHMVVQKELVRLFRASFQHIGNIDVIPAPAQFLPADHWSTFMSLPTHMGLSNEEIRSAPGIEIPGFSINPLWKAKDRKFHVAVAWHGHPAGDINHYKSFPFELLLELCRVPGIQLYSIQVGDAANDLHKAGAAVLVRDLAPQITDVADTMAILQHMDLLISVESLPMHIGCAIGLETWVPYSFRGRDWRVSRTKDLGWYPKQVVFPQRRGEGWPEVFNRIVSSLMEASGAN